MTATRKMTATTNHDVFWLTQFCTIYFHTTHRIRYSLSELGEPKIALVDDDDDNDDAPDTVTHIHKQTQKMQRKREREKKKCTEIHSAN